MKETYVMPTVEVLEVEIEKGFATSGGYAEAGCAGMLMENENGPYNF